MKRILSFIAILSFVSGLAFAYDEGSKAHSVRSIGGPVDAPVRIYELVRYPDNGVNIPSLSAGDVVVWDCVSDDGVSVNLVTTAGSADAVAGVVVSSTIPTQDVGGNTAAQDVGRRNWGYIQVFGFNDKTNITGGSATVGKALVASDIARYATAGPLVLGRTFTRSLGFSVDASSDGQSESFITCD